MEVESWHYLGLLIGTLPKYCLYTFMCPIHEARSHPRDVNKLLMTISLRAAACTYHIICTKKVLVDLLDGGGTPV